MPKTRINCPNCRQPLIAEVDQLFDAGADPTYKQRLLSGSFNVIQCQNCGYQGVLATPIVYHDPQKEMLLTYFPPELNIPRDDQERIIGSMINQVVNRLSQEQRKGYLLRPQAVFTLQGLLERILEADGITKEMLQAQQDRLNLIQRLLSASSDAVIQEVVKQDDAKMDSDFFNLLSRLIEAATAGGNQEGGKRLSDLQQRLLPLTTKGKELQEQTKEVEAAIKSLREAGKELTRDKLVELVIDAPSETRLSVLVSLTRPAMDYAFFQLLSEKIDRARGAGRERLISLREKLLVMTREIDLQMEERAAQGRQLLNQILQAPDVNEASQKNLPAMDEFFAQALETEIAAARKTGDLAKIEKLQKVMDVVQKASAPPPEVVLLEELLDIEQETARRSWLEAHRDAITPEFIETLTSFLARLQGDEDKTLIERLQETYRSVLRFSMEINLSK